MSNSVMKNLVTTRDLLLKEIESLSYEDLNKKTVSDIWSIGQVCHHLFLTENVFTQAIIYGYNKVNGKKADPKAIQVTADRTQKIKAPDIVVPKDGPWELQQITEQLHQSRNIFLDFYNQIEDKSVLSEKSTKHPLFGYLPLNQWVDLIYIHEERHIEQIKELKSSL